ncbi:MAG: segregation/condensation protein A [Eubacteriaceae bacterium]|jgi:segregation and condensation protein A|nr:segregation/condensation protein A [Eubacteriaceae bacterium]
MAYKVKLNAFEGPFDLLVYLIENARMSIYDIRVSEITTQYIEYLNEMQRLDVNIASEFMVLAAELIELKSKMLLPHAPVSEDGTYEDDPRSELVAKLLEYKRFKAISEMLRSREEENRRIYTKPQEDISEFTDSPDEVLTLSMPQFAAAFNLFIEKKKKVQLIQDHYQRIERQKISAEQRAGFIKSLFVLNGSEAVDTGRVVPFNDLVPDKNDKYDMALSFTAMLEMIKQRRLTAQQASLFAEIFVRATERLNKEENDNDQQTLD